MIDQVHADAEVAAALQDALSKGKEKAEKDEAETLLEGGPVFESVPPVNPFYKVTAPIAKGEFDDLIPPWIPDEEAPPYSGSAGATAPQEPSMPMDVQLPEVPSEPPLMPLPKDE